MFVVVPSLVEHSLSYSGVVAFLLVIGHLDVTSGGAKGLGGKGRES